MEVEKNVCQRLADQDSSRRGLAHAGLDEHARTAIIAHAEAMHAKHCVACIASTETDLKLPLSRAQLLALVGQGGGGSHSGGEEAVARLECVFRRFGCDAYTILVRLVQALGRSKACHYIMLAI